MSALYGTVAGRARLEPAAPAVDRATVWIGTVERGPMLRQVCGNGTLVPESVRWIPAETSGRVERRVLDHGGSSQVPAKGLTTWSPSKVWPCCRSSE
jgi:hypothetical protein